MYCEKCKIETVLAYCETCYVAGCKYFASHQEEFNQTNDEDVDVPDGIAPEYIETPRNEIV